MMKKFAPILLLLLCLTLLPSGSFAENTTIPLTMEELDIKVLPEFAYHPLDKEKTHPPLLIGYQGTLINHSDLPMKGTIQIPLPVTEKNFRIGYVADYSSDLTKAHEIEYTVDQEQGTISWTTSEKIPSQGRYRFIIEYYTDSLKVTKNNRSLDYHFKSFTDIELLNITITHPYKAKNIKLTPKPAETSHEDNSSTYYFQKVKPGDEKSFAFTYKREATAPTMEVLDNKQPGKAEDKNSHTLLIASVSGLSLLTGGGLTVFFRKRKKLK